MHAILFLNIAAKRNIMHLPNFTKKVGTQIIRLTLRIKNIIKNYFFFKIIYNFCWIFKKIKGGGKKYTDLASLINRKYPGGGYKAPYLRFRIPNYTSYRLKEDLYEVPNHS